VGSHSRLFNAALENPAIHDLEHALYSAQDSCSVAGGRLDPSPWRMPHRVRTMYVFLQMPQNTFLRSRS